MNSTINLFDYFLNLLLLTPVVAIVRAIAPRPAPLRAVIACLGVYLLHMVTPRFALFYLGYWTAIWAFQHLMAAAEHDNHRASAVLKTTFVIMIALSPMLLVKAAPEFVLPRLTTVFSHAYSSLLPPLGFADALVGVVEPLGLSFSVFRAIDLMVKVRLGLLAPLSADRVLFFGLFPPVLAFGPIAEYEEVRMDHPLPRVLPAGDVAVGLFRFGVGCVKIFIVAYGFERLAALWWANGTATGLGAWGALFAYALYFYLNFSGYSDLAIGTARLLGFRIKENFNNPYAKTSPQAFWNSWHMSLTRWTQRYVFVPLGGMRPNKQYFAIFMTIMVIALWHGLNGALIVFGLYHASFVLVHRWLDQRRQRQKRRLSDQRWVVVAKAFGVFTYVALSLPMLVLPLGDFFAFYRRLLPVAG